MVRLFRRGGHDVDGVGMPHDVPYNGSWDVTSSGTYITPRERKLHPNPGLPKQIKANPKHTQEIHPTLFLSRSLYYGGHLCNAFPHTFH